MYDITDAITDGLEITVKLEPEGDELSFSLSTDHDDEGVDLDLIFKTLIMGIDRVGKLILKDNFTRERVLTEFIEQYKIMPQPVDPYKNSIKI